MPAIVMEGVHIDDGKGHGTGLWLPICDEHGPLGIPEAKPAAALVAYRHNAEAHGAAEVEAIDIPRLFAEAAGAVKRTRRQVRIGAVLFACHFSFLTWLLLQAAPVSVVVAWMANTLVLATGAVASLAARRLHRQARGYMAELKARYVIPPADEN